MVRPLIRWIRWYDEQKMMMYKTVEIIIDNKPWQRNAKKVPKHKSMDISIGHNEIELRGRIKACGGKWDSQRKVWELPYEKVKELDLLDRIIDDEF